MHIKNIFNVFNYKGLDDNFRADFDDITYIIGDNAKNKSTVGSIPVWILTGYNLLGSNKEVVANDRKKETNTVASLTFIDNDGVEHVVTRSKGKDNFVMLDGIRTTQEMINKFYKDVHAFISCYCPTYFRSLELVKQRQLLLRVLPTITIEDVYKLLSEKEKEVLPNIPLDITEFCKAKREEIKELKSEKDINIGRKATFERIALQKEDELLEFTKNKELEELKDKYEKLITDSNEIVNIQELKKDIEKIETLINSNIQDELPKLKEKREKEVSNLNNVQSISSTCPTCKQPIKNENLINALSITYNKNISKIANDIQALKNETQQLMENRKSKLEQYNLAVTPEAQQKEKLRQQLKEKIDVLNEEKRRIDIYNSEVSVKHKQIVDAKNNIEICEKAEKEINEELDKIDRQIKIANKLNFYIIEEQMKKVNKYLDKVTIQFTKINEISGNLEDVYIIKYNGREYEKLSKSYKLRADIEIARLISKVTDINSPIFIDDSESITDLNFNIESQIIISKVIKFNELEILYSYPDVLEREKESINKKILQNNNLSNVA